MKHIQRIFSFVISTALACSLVTNAFAATGTAKAAAPVPTITLTASSSTVSVGDTVTVSLAIDGTQSGFAALKALLNYNADAFSPSAVNSISNADARGFGVTKPTVSTSGLTALVLDSTENLKAAFDPAVTYTFKATQAGTFDFSVSGSVSAVGCTASKLNKVSTISVAVSAKPLTAQPVQNAKLHAEYGHTMGDLAKSIQAGDFVLKSGDTDVTGTVQGKWSAEAPDAIPAAGTTSAKFLFTPENSKEYSAAEAIFALEITPKAVVPTLSVEPAEKMYDGSADLTVDQEAALSLDGVMKADEGRVSAVIGSIAYDAADSGERTITASNIALTGEQNSNYTLRTDSCSAKGSIVPCTGEVSVRENFTSRSYTGAEQPLQESELVLTANGQTLQPDTDYTITYPHGCTGAENADTEIFYTLTGKGNYAGCTFTGSTGKFTILARPLPTVKTGSSLGGAITAVYQQAYALPTVSNDILNETDAEGTLSLRYKQGSGEWSDNVPTMPGEYTIGMYFESSTDKYSSGMLNGISTTLTIQKAEGSGSVTVNQSYVYGEAITPEAQNGTGEVSFTFTGRNGTDYAESAAAPTKVGSYTVTARFAATTNATECTATADFSITAKGLVADDFTLSGTEFTYTGSEQKPAVSVAEGRDLAEGTDYAVQYPEASTNAGSYKVTVTGKGNYSGSVELSYKILPAGYTLPQNAKIVTELAAYPASIYGGQPLSHIGLKAEGLPEGAQFGWKAGDTKLGSNPGTASYEITVNPTDPNYSEGTATVSVKLVNAVVPADSKEGITNQLSTFAASISKTASENGTLKAGASADIAKLTLSGKLTPKEQDDLKSAHLSDAALLDVLDKSAENVTVSTQLNKGDRGDKSALTGLAITTGGKAALGAANGTATYTAKDITPEKPADGQLIEVELSLGSGKQPAVPVLVSLSFNAKNADPNGKFQVVHKHTETDPSKNFTTQYDCRSVSKSGDTVTVQFLAASFSSFSIQYTAPASGGSSSSSSSGAAPKPDEPQPQPTAAPALTASETTWLGGYGALLNAKSGTALSLDVTACEYLPGYIITGVQKSGVTLNLTTPAGKLCLSPAVAKAMNGSYNYTFADALAIAGKVAAAAKPAASPAPVKDPTAASPTPAPTPVPTAAPQPTQAPTPQPEVDTPEKSHSPLPVVAAVLVAAALLAGGYLAYNSASRRKALHDVYAPSKKVNLNQNQNNGRSRK